MILVKFAKYWMMFFAILMVVAFGIIFNYGLKFSIEFTGGSVIEFQTKADISNEKIREIVAGFEGVTVSSVTKVGEDNFVVKLSDINDAKYREIIDTLKVEIGDEPNGEVTEKRFNTVGPTVGKELRQRSLIAIGIALIVILAYISYVFRHVSYPLPSYIYGLAALLALFHDVVLPTAVFAVLGKMEIAEIDVLFVIALLSILGSSVNDTIVVFDRIRENLKRYGSGDFYDVVLRSFRQTIVRSLNTALSLVFVLSAIFWFGGASIKYFALAMLLGSFFGTYSSIFLAIPFLVFVYDWKYKK
jgi:preprotein translocase SecF subunit